MVTETLLHRSIVFVAHQEGIFFPFSSRQAPNHLHKRQSLAEKSEGALETTSSPQSIVIL